MSAIEITKTNNIKNFQASTLFTLEEKEKKLNLTWLNRTDDDI